MTISRIPKVLISLAAILALYLLMTVAHLMGAAHADTGTTPGLDLTGVSAVIVAFAVGVFMILSGLSIVLHKIAPLTKSTWDDRAAVTVDHFRDFAQEIRDLLVPSASAVGPTTVIKIPPKSDPPISTGGITGVVTVCLICLATAGIIACAGIKSDVKVAESAILDCTKQEAKPLETALLDVIQAAAKYILKLGAVDFTALGKEVLSDGRDIAACAYAEYKAASAPPVVSIAHAVGPRVQDPVVVKYGSILTSRGLLQ